MDGGLGAQVAALRVVSLIVKFDGVAIDAMFDAYSLGPAFEVTDHFSGEFLGYLAAQGEVFAQKTHDIGAGEGGHCMVDPAWIEAPQVGRVVEDHIDGPLVLVSRPVVGDGMFMEDLGVDGVELASDAVEQLGPSGFELTIQQALSFGPIGNPREAVVLLQVIETGGLPIGPKLSACWIVSSKPD